MTQFEAATVMSSLVALSLSLFNSYWLHLRAGEVRATIPSQFAIKPHRNQNSTASITIQTLIYATGATKLIVDRLYCQVERAGVTQSFSTWQTTQVANVQQRRAGLVIDGRGVDEAFSFFVTPGTEEFRFLAGEYSVEMLSRTAKGGKDKAIFRTKITLTSADAELLRSGGAIQFFRHPTSDKYIKLQVALDGTMTKVNE